jgi:hypothetical protein
LRKGLRDIGITPPVEERIVGIMQAFYASVDIVFNFTLPSDIPREQAEAIGAENQRGVQRSTAHVPKPALR